MNVQRPDTRSSPTLDIDSTLARLQGDKDFLFTLFSVFLEDLPTKLDKMDAALDARDMTTLIRTAHSLKGACATVGALALRDEAYQLEQAATNDQRAEAKQSVLAIHALASLLTKKMKESIQAE